MLEMKMQIAIDEEKAKLDGVIPKMIYDTLDRLFAGFEALKEVQEDGSIMYISNPKHGKTTFSDFGIAYMELKGYRLFARYCTQWYMFDRNYAQKEFYKKDLLEKQRKQNPLYRRG